MASPDSKKKSLDDWKNADHKDWRWASFGVGLAKRLRKSGCCQEAASVCSEILQIKPSYSNAKKEYGWCLYDGYIKSDHDKVPSILEKDKRNLYYQVKEEKAQLILAHCRKMEPYSAYVHTCLRMAEFARTAEMSLKWLEMLDEKDLDNRPFSFRSDKTSSRDKISYWSQLRKFLELKMYASKDLETKFRLGMQLRAQCCSSLAQKDQLHSRLYYYICQIHKHRDDQLIDHLLIHRGFTNENFRRQYRAALDRRFATYLCWDREKNEPFFEPNLAAIAVQLQKELLVQPEYKKSYVQGTSRAVNVSDLANFKFCPASYAIQQTYAIQTSAIGNIGTAMHDQQLLISAKVEKTRGAFVGLAKKKLKIGSGLPGVSEKIQEHISPLLQDVSKSDLIFCGHGQSRRKLFYGAGRKLVGTPDYVFMNGNRERFVVEEKFSYQKPRTRLLNSPYDNHLAQLLAYMTLLEGLEAEYGYILYWRYSIGDQSKYPYISSAQVFKINASESLKKDISDLLQSILNFNAHGQYQLSEDNLNSWKCVNCVTSDYCQHKTGTDFNLTLPYHRRQEGEN